MGIPLNLNGRFLWSKEAWYYWYESSRGEKTYHVSDSEEINRYKNKDKFLKFINRNSLNAQK